MKPRSQLNCRVLANCLALWLFWGLFAGAGHCYAAPSLAQNDPVKGVAQLSEASDPSNSTIHSNILRKRGATCRSNLVVNAPRCFGANRPSSNPQIGSLNGVWAFILDNGLPRIVAFSDIEGLKTRWTIRTTTGIPGGCARYDLKFEQSGDIVFRCGNVIKARLIVNNRGVRPRRFWIDNTGIVRFISQNGKTILTIDPATGPSPESALRLEPVVALSVPWVQESLSIPKLDRRNRIIKQGCRYVPVPYPAKKDPTTSFNIELVSCGSTPSLDTVFIRAAQTWSSVITGDLLDFEMPPGTETECLADFDGEPVMTCGHIDDIIIGYSVGPVDGLGGQLGAAGPVYTRGQEWPRHRELPITGWMQFDEADLNSNSAAFTIVLHEMAHVLGFGTIWSELKLLSTRNCGALSEAGIVRPMPRFLGQAAARMLKRINYTAGIQAPIEHEGGKGHACHHWSERHLSSELMTTYLSNDGYNPISVLTASAFADMGYKVDMKSPILESFDAKAAAKKAQTGARFKRGEAGHFEMKGCLHGWKLQGSLPYLPAAEGDQ